ncbi:MAG: electron transporter RnfE, partial [Oscillospiraceae bacterium]|nr:electron transporter RnfE [Oscillospiraceae bacterium]
GLGYTCVLIALSASRELLGNGTFGGGLLNGGKGITLIPQPYPAMLIILPFGGFIALGCLIALIQWLTKRRNGGASK